jgi:uncharacterized protein YbjT (DUF2867 family)
MTGERSVLLCGATGLVGGECLKLLSADPFFARVITLIRRPLEPEARSALDLRKVEEHVVDFEALDAYRQLLQVDQVFCALGTTLRKAGSRERFRQVDLHYPLTLARLALQQGARHFLLVSSAGADPRSRIFYSRVKGETEEAVGALPFESVTILRPSLLLGKRRERRWAEEIAKRLGFLAPPRFRPVAATAVATALVRAAKEDLPGRRTLESRDIRALADAEIPFVC